MGGLDHDTTRPVTTQAGCLACHFAALASVMTEMSDCHVTDMTQTLNYDIAIFITLPNPRV